MRKKLKKVRIGHMLDELYYKTINGFTYDGLSSNDFGIIVNKTSGAHGEPQAVLQTVAIPGKGKIIINNKEDELDNEQYEDTTKSYDVHVVPVDNQSQNIDIIARNIHRWLFQDVRYKKLTDTYEPGYFRKAYAYEQMSLARIAAGLIGKLTITFTCKAYKYSYSGLETITMTAPGHIFNTEGFTSKPLIRVYGVGDVILYINNRAHAFDIDDGYIDIDSENMNAYKNDILKNNHTAMTRYPKFAPGSNEISWLGNVQKIEIEPRWCTL